MSKPRTRTQGTPRPEQARGLAGARRREHFETGGSVTAWRGRSARYATPTDRHDARGRTHRTTEHD